MKEPQELRQNRRLSIMDGSAKGFTATLVHPNYKDGQVFIVASWGMDWEYVSVLLKNRCPTWGEMCKIKDIFWEEDECVVQIHPPKSEYVNLHPYCIHLWKKVGSDFEMPPKICV